MGGLETEAGSRGSPRGGPEPRPHTIRRHGSAPVAAARRIESSPVCVSRARRTFRRTRSTGGGATSPRSTQLTRPRGGAGERRTATARGPAAGATGHGKAPSRHASDRFGRIPDPWRAPTSWRGERRAHCWCRSDLVRLIGIEGTACKVERGELSLRVEDWTCSPSDESAGRRSRYLTL